MLILDRKIGQRIFIDKGSIQLTVMRIDGDLIKIGFSAPAHIDIEREEIFVKKLIPRDEPHALNIQPTTRTFHETIISNCSGRITSKLNQLRRK